MSRRRAELRDVRSGPDRPQLRYVGADRRGSTASISNRRVRAGGCSVALGGRACPPRGCTCSLPRKPRANSSRETASLLRHSTTRWLFDQVDLGRKARATDPVRRSRGLRRCSPGWSSGIRRSRFPAVVLRCSVWAVDPEAVTYRIGLRLEELCVPIRDELATRTRLLHAPP